MLALDVPPLSAALMGHGHGSVQLTPATATVWAYDVVGAGLCFVCLLWRHTRDSMQQAVATAGATGCVLWWALSVFSPLWCCLSSFFMFGNMQRAVATVPMWCCVLLWLLAVFWCSAEVVLVPGGGGVLTGATGGIWVPTWHVLVAFFGCFFWLAGGVVTWAPVFDGVGYIYWDLFD